MAKNARSTEFSQRLGVTLSTLCAIHCLAMPVLFATLPVAGSALHDFHWVEFPLIGLGVAIALTGIVKNFRREMNVSAPAILLGLGIVVLTVSHFALGEHSNAWIGTTIGALAIAASQLLNIRHARQCDRCEH